MRSNARASSRQWTRPANRPSASSARPLPTRGRNRPRIGHIREGEAGKDPDPNIIDCFMEAFGNSIDSGFGTLSGEVAFLTTGLNGIDGNLAARWWSMENEQAVLGKHIQQIG